jgi:N-acyl amino acid synthase of PEP-CTERM/exosortase system
LNVTAFFDLATAFQCRFRIVPADSAELRDVCYRLRHAIYCQELAFEPVRKDGRETDEWDAESIHCLVQSVTTGQYVGCARLVIPPSVHPSAPLPFERVCESKIGRTFVDSRLPRESIAEVSRLAVIADYRRCTGEQAARAVVSERASTEERVIIPSVLTVLLLGLLALARQHGIDTAFMLVERRLARYLGTSMGFRPKIIGGPVEHRGPRLLAMLRVPEALDGLNALVQPLFDAICADIRGALPSPAPLHVPHKFPIHPSLNFT